TPTYHVFDLYQSHRGAQSVRLVIEKQRELRFNESQTMPALSGSASVRGDALTISMVNAHATEPMEVELALTRGRARDVRVSTLSHSSITAHNTFETPHEVEPAGKDQPDLRTTLPAASVTVLCAIVS